MLYGKVKKLINCNERMMCSGRSRPPMKIMAEKMTANDSDAINSDSAFIFVESQ